MKPLYRLLPIVAAGMGAATLLLAALSLPMQASPARYDFPAGATLIPLGAGQPDDLARRNAYKELWRALYGRSALRPNGPPPLAWTAVTATVDGTDYGPGAVIGDLRGPFFQVTASGPFSVPRSFALHPRRVALFYPTVRDEYGQIVAWEEGDFEQLFRVYLWCELPPASGGPGGVGCPCAST